LKGLVVRADWMPKPEYDITEKEEKKHITLRGNMVWKNPSYTLEKNLPIPEYSPNEILIKVKACGICGSDVNMCIKDEEGYIAFPSRCGFPVTIGHEFSGEVVEVGKTVTQFRVGDLVTAEECYWCGTCDNCKNGNFSQCINLNILGFDKGFNGALADYISVNEKNCYSLNKLTKVYDNEEEIFEIGALVEPMADVYEGIFHIGGGFNPGEHVAIFGAGAIGLASIHLARISGAAKIIAFEPIKIRRKLAEDLGADYVFNPFNSDYTPGEMIMELTDGRGVGMAIEASGSPSYSLPEIEKGIAINGKIIILGMAAQFPRFDLMVYQRKKLHLNGVFSQAGNANFSNIINLAASRRIDMRKCITDRYHLENIIEAINKAKTGNSGKIMVKMK
jgi:scyllo-inosose 3-dehydrogenase